MNDVLKGELQTPALIINKIVMLDHIKTINALKSNCQFSLLLSLKPLTIKSALESICSEVDGFSVASLYQARLARSILNNRGTIHYTSPGIRKNEFSEIMDIVDYLSFNSITQYNFMRNYLNHSTNAGIRINPRLSFVRDSKYDPCTKYSKLGVNIDWFDENRVNNKSFWNGISGLHFHNNCDSNNLNELKETANAITSLISNKVSTLKWINLGGGYLYNNGTDYTPFYETVNELRQNYGLDIFIEPGADIVRKAGSLVCTVIDVIYHKEKNIAVLDTTINHMPEVFEYQYEPEVEGHRDGAPNTYILAGCSCLAGDLFGEYSFEEPLKIGSRIVFKDMGAYTLVKANMFNGINLPTIYSCNEDGEIELIKEYTYTDFLTMCGD